MLPPSLSCQMPAVHYERQAGRTNLELGLDGGALLWQRLVVQEGILLTEATRVIPSAQVLEAGIFSLSAGRTQRRPDQREQKTRTCGCGWIQNAHGPAASSILSASGISADNVFPILCHTEIFGREAARLRRAVHAQIAEVRDAEASSRALYSQFGAWKCSKIKTSSASSMHICVS